MGRLSATAALALMLATMAWAAPLPRGVDPALAPRYTASADGTFACLDGRKTIPFAQVNDDYCDCLDGSDEPGTSACPNGLFYCENKFFLPLRLNASMVDDGVCDCCDGTDEPAGRCENSCYNKGMQDLIALKDQVRSAEEGAAARARYAADAVGTKKGWATRKDKIEAQLATKRAAADKAEAERTKLEAEQSELRDQRTKLEEQKAKLDEAQAAKAAEAAGGQQGAASDGQQADADGQQPEATDGQADAAAAADPEHDAAMAAAEAEAAAAAAEMAEAEAQLAAAEAQMAEGGAGAGAGAGGEAESEEKLAKERMAQWIPGAKDGDAAAAAAAGEGEEAPTDDPAQFFLGDDAAAGTEPDAGGGGGGDGAAAAAAGEEGAASAPPAEQPTTALGKARFLLSKLIGALTGGRGAAGAGGVDGLAAEIAALDAKIAALEKKLGPVRTNANDFRSAVRELERESGDLTSKLGAAYGEADVFVALVDKCFEAKVDKYSYEVCPFGKASQKEGHSSTSLGTWAGLQDNETVMAFKNGQTCWQGPPRSMTVSLRCGKKERLAHVEEPSRCQYNAELETPAACSPEAAAALTAELRKRQRLLEGDAGEDPAAAGRVEL